MHFVCVCMSVSVFIHVCVNAPVLARGVGVVVERLELVVRLYRSVFVVCVRVCVCLFVV